MQLWQKHFILKLLKTFLLFFSFLFAIYVIVDLSAHGVRFFSKATLLEIALFYLHSLSSLLDLFLTLTFLLAVLRVLIDLNSHGELVALQMAGISKKRLLFPFFAFAFFLASASYANGEWIAPRAGQFSSGFKTAYKAKKRAKPAKLHTISLEDKTELIAREIDLNERALFDVYWIRSQDDIWHMKSLNLDTLEGKFVNHLVRTKVNLFGKSESFEALRFTDLPWKEESLFDRFIPYENRPISTLIKQALSRRGDARIVFSHLYHKLLSPLIPFLVLIALAPIAMHYSRNKPIFLITALSIFALIAFKTIIDGMLILGENLVLPSYIALFSPVIAVLSVTAPSFMRMR